MRDTEIDDPRARRVRALFHVLIVFIGFGLAVAYAQTIVPGGTELLLTDDFTSFYESVSAFARGEGLYPPLAPRMEPNLNNPHTTLLLFGPVGGLPIETAFFAYSAFSLVLVLGAVPFLVGAVEPEGSDPWRLAAVALLVLAWPVTFWSAHRGQVGFVLMPLVGAGWLFLARERESAAGVALGLALSMKVFLGLFVPVLLVARRWRAAAVTLVTALGVYALGIGVLGWDLYVQHFGMLREPPDVGFHNNASLLGQITRFEQGRFGMLPPTDPIYLLAAGLAAGMVLLATFRARTVHAVVGTTVAGMLLISPLAWLHYLPLLVIPLLVAWRAGGWVRWTAASAWLIAAAPFSLDDLSLQWTGLTIMFLVMLVVSFGPAGDGDSLSASHVA